MRGVGLRQGDGVKFLELLACLLVLALEPDEFFLDFLVEIARAGGMRLETGSEPVEKIHRLSRAQQVIHNPS
jgi:hypothetical protein